MNPEIFEYLRTQRVGILAVEMPDGSPHAATIHYAHSDEPFVLYFGTHEKTRKAESIVAKGSARASFVVGADEATMITLQLDGIVERVPESEMDTYRATYLGKMPEKQERYNAPGFLPLKFTPTWHRFSPGKK